jgi:hypothetical protein
MARLLLVLLAFACPLTLVSIRGLCQPLQQICLHRMLQRFGTPAEAFVNDSAI